MRATVRDDFSIAARSLRMPMHAARAIGALVLLVALAPMTSRAGAEFDNATGYRIDRYRAPVDRPLEGGAAVSLEDVDRLVKEGAALVDVMPARAGYDPKTGVWRIVEERKDIPGSAWLPEVGRGALDRPIAAYFEKSLKKLTAESPDRALIFYCLADCWMSWNAVKRAASLGYKRLYWYPEGSDGWRDANRPLADGAAWPVPVSEGDERSSGSR